MTIVSSKEFATNQDRYYDLAVSDDVFIERDDDMFHLMCATADDAGAYDEILEPDEDFYRALSADEFRKRLIEVVERVDKIYARK
ncbi:MAG: hypothetical protein FWG84_01765 [Bacteroidales bacterium]|nr:hypothetical protein [Bacteroidales bacterium]